MIRKTKRARQLSKHLQKPTASNCAKLESLLFLPEVESWRSLMAAFQAVYQELERALLQEGCSISRFQILLSLYFWGPLSASEIAKRLCVTRGNISMFLKRLKSDGLVEAEMARGIVANRAPLQLTKKGRALFEKLFPGHIRRVKRLVPAMPSGVLTTLKRIAEVSDGS